MNHHFSPRKNARVLIRRIIKNLPFFNFSAKIEPSEAMSRCARVLRLKMRRNRLHKKHSSQYRVCGGVKKEEIRKREKKKTEGKHWKMVENEGKCGKWMGKGEKVWEREVWEATA